MWCQDLAGQQETVRDQQEAWEERDHEVQKMKEREEALLKQIQQEWEVAYSKYQVKLPTEPERK
jgi:hypothetical protein